MQNIILRVRHSTCRVPEVLPIPISLLPIDTRKFFPEKRPFSIRDSCHARQVLMPRVTGAGAWGKPSRSRARSLRWHQPTPASIRIGSGSRREAHGEDQLCSTATPIFAEPSPKKRNQAELWKVLVVVSRYYLVLYLVSIILSRITPWCVDFRIQTG